MDRILVITGQTLDMEAAKSGATNSMDWEANIIHIIVSSLRKSPAETSMDRFVSHHVHPSIQYRYHISLIHHLLACLLPIESQAIVQLCCISARSIVRYNLLVAASLYNDMAGQMCDHIISPGTVAGLYRCWEMMNKYIGKYYLNPFSWGEGL